MIRCLLQYCDMMSATILWYICGLVGMLGDTDLLLNFLPVAVKSQKSFNSAIIIPFQQFRQFSYVVCPICVALPFDKANWIQCAMVDSCDPTQ